MPLFRFALRYFAVTFALAFAVGVVRTLWLVPAVGEVRAVLAEVPLILGFSAWWARRLLRRRPLPTRRAALSVGAIAFALLLAAELATALLLGRSAGGWLASLGTPAGLLGLAGQLGFALMPWLVRDATARR
jgi:hypothetical protein